MFDQIGSKASIFFSKKNYNNSLNPQQNGNKKAYTILERVSNYLQTLEPL